jgi:hypothetical protein
MESLELEEQKVWKHELKGEHPIFFFLFWFWVWWVPMLIFNRGQLPPPLFLLFFKAGGCHYRVSAKSQAPSFSFFFICVLLLLGVGGFHCQLLAPFFFIFFC